MTKTQRRTQKGVAAILAAANLTQKQLAELIGASLDTVKGWTRKMNPSPISRHFESRIMLATGAIIKDDGSVVTSWQGSLQVENRFRKDDRSVCETIYYGGIEPAGKPFTVEAFTFWRTYVAKSDEVLAALYSFEAADFARRIFHAAIQPVQVGRGKVRGQRNKLPAVWNSFYEWQIATRENFNLSRQLDALGEDYFKDNPTPSSLLHPTKELRPTFAPDLPVVVEGKNRAGIVVETKKTTFAQFNAGHQR
ncbi:MAG: helix-turn-helix transcriptional regulator [Verrucomicrobiia bacterium]